MNNIPEFSVRSSSGGISIELDFVDTFVNTGLGKGTILSHIANVCKSRALYIVANRTAVLEIHAIIESELTKLVRNGLLRRRYDGVWEFNDPFDNANNISDSDRLRFEYLSWSRPLAEEAERFEGAEDFLYDA